MRLRAWRVGVRRGMVGLVTIAVLAAGCDSSSPAAGGERDTLVVFTGQAGDYQVNFNPFSPTLIEGPGTIFEPLFFYNITRDVEPRPRLGTEFSWNAEGTELSVTLRDGVRWQDGQTFTARDVVFTLDMISKHPTMNATGYRGTARAVDDTHVVITFAEPSFMDGPQILGKIFVVPEHLWKDIADPATDTVAEPVGTGPFLLDEFKAQAFTLRSNPDYHGGEPAVKKVRYLALSGNQAGADALRAGQIDWQTGPVPDIHDVERNYPGYRAITVPMQQAALFTCGNAAMGCAGAQTDPAVRQAVYHALNRTQVNSLAFDNTASPVSPGYALLERDKSVVSGKLLDDVAPMRPNETKARQVLESAGYARGADGVYAKDGRPLALTLKVVAGWTDYITAVDLIGQQLERVGITLTPQQLSWNEWADARGRGQYELIIDSLYQGPAPDPFYVYSYFFSTATTARVGEAANPNFSRFSDPQVDAAIAALKRINPEDVEARQPHFDVIQTRIEQVMPYIPILTGGTTSEYNASKFTGWPTEDDLYAFPAIWSRPDQSEIFMRLRPAQD